MQTHTPTMTLDDIEARRFTFVQAFVENETFEVRRFLVATPSGPEAKRRTPEVFARLFPGKTIRKFHVYPKTYVKDARLLLHEGLAE